LQECLGASNIEDVRIVSQDFLANVAPKKPNWDLRRDVEKKLAKLERRTQRALVQIQQQQAQEAQ
jgi:coiled-coil domain-containing protein 12